MRGRLSKRAGIGVLEDGAGGVAGAAAAGSVVVLALAATAVAPGSRGRWRSP